MPARLRCSPNHFVTALRVDVRAKLIAEHEVMLLVGVGCEVALKRGRHRRQLGTAERLADALGVPPSVLLSRHAGRVQLPQHQEGNLK